MECFYSDDNLVIRKMMKEDIDTICKSDNDTSDGNSAYLQNQIDNQNRGDSVALLALLDGKAAGYTFIYYKCKWGGLGNQGVPGIVDLVVFPPYRNKGVASKLMDMAEDIARLKSDKVYLDVCLNSDYGSAQRLYIKRGFVPDGKGVYYKEKICSINGICKNDDELTLCLVKSLV